MIKEYKKARIGSFFCKNLQGIGIILDLDAPYYGHKPKFVFELKLIYYKLWIVYYEKK